MSLKQRVLSVLSSPAATVEPSKFADTNYKNGVISMTYRLLPQHQNALEAELACRESERAEKVNAAGQKFGEAMRVAREAYDKARAEATAARDKVVNEAHRAFDAAQEALYKQYGRAPTAEELAMHRTKPGQVLDLRNVAPAGA